jgi:DNA-binding phage protein
MSKKKISVKQDFSLNDIPSFEVRNQHELTKFEPESYFADFNKVAVALLECLLDNDTEGYIEILDSYLRINRSRVAKNSALARSTVQQALSKKGNPTLKTIARIAHESAANK